MGAHWKRAGASGSGSTIHRMKTRLGAGTRMRVY